MDGYLLLLKLAATVVDGLTTLGLEHETDEVDLTGRSSTRDSEYTPGDRREMINFEGAYKEDHTYGYDTLYTAWKAGTSLAWIIAKANAGKTDFASEASELKKYSGNGYITRLALTGSRNGKTTFSGSLRVTGGSTQGTLASTA
jgi:hypothetical protein